VADDLVALTDQLALVLEDETALLEALNLPGAVKLLSRKRDAVAALEGALAAGAAAELDEEQSEALRESFERMARNAGANRVAIERGLALQMRLIDTIAQAIPRGRALEAPCYQPDGRKVPARPPEAYAFLSRM
jgi:hypothetical protein